MKNIDRSLVLLEKLCMMLFCLVSISLFSLVPITSRAQANRNSRAQPSSANPQKHTATIRASDSSEGSRVSIFSDSTLDDYEAYRRGDRFYVKLPAMELSQAQAKVQARGFEDVKVQKSGSSTLLSFHLQPGTTARVDQRGNRLEVIFTTPGGSQSATSASSPTATNSSGNDVVNGSTTSVPGSAPETPKSQSSPGTNTADVSSASSASPSASSQSSTLPANQATPSQQNPNDSWLGTGDWRTRLKFYGEMARLNWLPLVIGLLAVLLIVALLLSRRSRSRRRRDIVTLPKKLAKNEGAAAKARPIGASAERISGIKSATASPAVTSSPQSQSRERIATGPPVPLPASAQPVIQKKVDVARVQAEANSMLSGARYDNHITGTVDSGAREVIATELLSALAGRNPERRERAREAFIKSGYFDDATRDLRVAEAPAERASAARKLALARDSEATPHLVAALEDEAPEVRRAAVEALADLRDPAAIAPLNGLLSVEKDRKVPHALIRHAIEACAIVEQPATAASTPEEKGLVPAEMTSATMEPDREVIEI